MPKWRNRECTQCGKVEYTASKSEICMECFSSNKRDKTKADNFIEIESFGYEQVEFVETNEMGGRVFRALNPDCGHIAQMTMGNFRSSFIKTGGVLSCTSCGGKRRVACAMAGYMEKYAKDYDLEQAEDYRKKVSGISDKNYRDFIHIINPEGVVRAKFEYHLDHIKPVILCFKEGVSVEDCGAVENLQMLFYKDNLSKGSKY